MIAHHPHEATIMAHATGTLAPGMALVVATHLTFCPACRSLDRLAEAVGGALLDDLEPVALTQGAFDRVTVAAARPVPFAPPRPVAADLPPPLNRMAFGKWRYLTIGMRFRPLLNGGKYWAGLVEGAAGRTLPSHGHKGAEFTCVLRGSFSDGEGRYGPGDLVEVDAGLDHQPVIDAGGPCLSFIATEGVRMHGLFGVAQRVLGL